MAGHRSSMRPRIAALSLLHRPFLSDRVLRPLKCLKYVGVPQETPLSATWAEQIVSG